MATPAMNSTLQIPTITKDDLSAFHALVFGSPAPARSLPTAGAPYNVEDHQDEDDLGYYPDGAKRTLTEEQIAMFRHSEIYAIIREKQVRRENREAEGGGQLESVDPYNVPAMEIIGALAPDEQACSISNYYEGSCSSTFAEQKNLGISDTRKKRKRNHIDSNGSNGRSITSRGVVRELDSAMADDQVLDYGDESSNTELPMPHDPEVIQTVVGQEAHQTPKPITEGKKIWWPVIEPS